jgi:TonB-dependent starch-binding outer membrane protein SusC
MIKSLLKSKHIWMAIMLTNLIAINLYAQQRTVKGLVTDDQGIGLPGVSVLVKGSTNGTVTDTDGNYSLSVSSSNDVLVFSFIGYKPQEIYAGDQSTVNISLQTDIQQLSEVVVVGYGEQERKDLTGSVASVKAKDVTRVQVSSFDQALQGQIAGVQISNTGGAPGGGVNVLIRGVSSITGGVQPLFVIDGYPVTNSGIGNPLNTISPNDIESVDVLKDASATAIYGSRGSNGVIIITTKRGKSGAPVLEFNTFVGVQQVGKQLDMMNSQQFAQFVMDGRNAAYLDNNPTGNINDSNAVRPGVSWDISDKYRDPSTLTTTNWQDAIFRTAPISNYQLSATGGTDALRYKIAGGYFNQEGVVIESGLKRYNFSANIDGKLTEKLNFGLSLLPSYVSQRNVKTAGHTGELGIINSALAMDPSLPVYNPDGTFFETVLSNADGNASIGNPVKTAMQMKNPSSQFRFLGNMFLEYAILKDLKLKSSFGVDLNYLESSFWNPSTLQSSGLIGNALAQATNTKSTNWLSETTLSYKKTLGSDHVINVVGGYTAQSDYFNQVFVQASTFPDDLIPNINGGIPNLSSQGTAVNTLMSVLGRVNYAYQDKYLLTVTMRADGSSRFGKNKRWGAFPSASIGWRISEEGFMKNVTAVTNLKLRASYGITGNNAIGNYRANSLLGSTGYVIGNNVVNGVVPGSFRNDNLTWEEQSQANIGLDFSILNGRVNFTGDVYDKRNKDMLFNIQTPSSTGFTGALVNVGEVQNRGLELSVNTQNTVGAFKWSTNFNISFNQNQVLAMNSETARIFGSTGGRGNSNVTQVGSPIGVFYGRRWLGVFQSDAEAADYGTQPFARAGDLKFKDVNGDGKIDDNDREVIGNPNPRTFFGFNNNFSYKGFTLDIFLNGQIGQDVYAPLFSTNNSAVQNNLAFIDQARWRSADNPGSSDYGPGTGSFGRTIRGGRNNNTVYSSKDIYDASYIRVRQISLGYNFPTAFISKAKIQTARLYVTVNNAYTFTKYPFFDPEVGNAGGDQTALGVDWGTYPVNRSFTIGLDLKF